MMLVPLVTGCSWEDAEHLTGRVVSDTTARERRDDWIAAGVFEAIATEAISGYDKIIGLDFSDVSVDGSVHKSPAGGEGTGKSPVDRAKRGWKWSIATDTAGIPVGWSISDANIHDVHLLAPTLDVVAQRGLIGEIGTLWLDRGYDGLRVRDQLAERGIDDAIIAKHSRRKAGKGSKNPKLGLRWPVDGPIRGCPTTASSGATPTARASTARPNSPWRSPCSLRPSSSTGETGGRPRLFLSAEVLR